MMEEEDSILAAGRRLMQSRSAEDSARFAAALARAGNGAQIAALLDEDVTDDLPIADKTAAFEKLLELGPGTPALLRRFADHLWLHGPEHDDRVARLRAQADALEARR